MSKYQILFRIEAYSDLDKIERYYSKVSSSVTNNFFNEFTKTLNFIEQQPDFFQERYKRTKIAFFYKFPYGIHYQVKGNTIIVYRVLHTKRYF